MEPFDETRTRADTLERDESFDLISSEKVDGTAVYNNEDEKLGAIHHFMVGKRDGQAKVRRDWHGGRDPPVQRFLLEDNAATRGRAS